MDNSTASQGQHAGNVGTRQLKKQSNSDEQKPHHKGKTQSTTKPTFIGSTNVTNTTQKKSQLGDGSSPLVLNNGENSAQLQRRQDRQALALEMAAIDSNEGMQAEITSDQQDGHYFQMTPYAQGSSQVAGGKAGKSTLSDGVERRQNNVMGVSQSVGATGAGGPTSQAAPFNQIYQPKDGNLSVGHNQHGSVSSNHNGSRGRASGHGLSNGRTAGTSQHGADASKRKRKSSDKRQRRTSNNRGKEVFHDDKINGGRDPNGALIPPIDPFPSNGPVGSAGGQGSSSQTRSQSRGTAGASNFQMQPPSTQQMQQQQYMSNQEGASFQMFGNMQGQSGEDSIQPNSFNVNVGNLSMGGVNLTNNSGFPFGHNSQGQFMGGNNQAPQVHFIAKKQQFIAQISPEQLIQSDKRPYTAQSLNNFSQSAKRAGAVYSNTYGKGTFANGYQLANAAFNAQPAIYLGHLGGASKTHTNGFSFHPPNGQNNHKYSNSLYGDDVKPKIAGKDILHALGSSNGFSSGYSSDPYNSVMSAGLPATLTHSNRPTKAKATQNRLQTKEKEQLYDETIKMKMLNNQLRDDSVKLKTKIKILENELNRKEKTIEDLFSHNQLIQQSQAKGNSSNSNQSLLPLAQTAQKYQQETFLVMSLKKQIRELKYEVVKRDEELEVLRKNIRNTKTKEMEQEIQSYREECLRQRAIIEDLLKQGASHPIHQQAYHERLNQMQVEIQKKDQLIQQMKDQMNVSLKLDNTAYYSSQSGVVSNNQVLTSTTNAAATAATHTNSMVAMRSQESQQLESSPSNADVTTANQALSTTNTAGQSFYGQSLNVPGREKSAERKTTNATSQYATQATQKEMQRDLQKAKKVVREKEKEIMKLKNEINHIRRESQEKLKNDNQQQKDNESQVKQLREKQRDLKMELKRKDDKLGEAEIKSKKLEEQLKEVNEALKSQEESNKQLKSQLRQAKNQKQVIKPADQKPRTAPDQTPQLLKDDKKEKVKDLHNEKEKEKVNEKITEQAKEEAVLQSVPSEPESIVTKKFSQAAPKDELKLITLIGQREKLSRDDLTAMMLAGEESLKMLIRKPSDELINFIKSNLDDEDQIVVAIPRYEIPKSDFESQVLREMRLVLRENADKITDKTQEELMKWPDFEEFYNSLENFDYPHKDKLLDFIKYFFLDHIMNKDLILMNFQAFKEHVSARRPLMASAERTRNTSSLRSRRKSGDSASYSGSAEDSTKRRFLGLSDEERADEEKMLDVAEQCFMRIADLLHSQMKTVKQVFLKYSEPEPFKDGSILELVPPRAFIEGVREVGFEDISDMEVACLMKVLAKPELDGAVILNEFILIMENFGVPSQSEEEEQENDYIADSDSESNLPKPRKLEEQPNNKKDDQLPKPDQDKDAEKSQANPSEKEAKDQEKDVNLNDKDKKDEIKDKTLQNDVVSMKKRAAEASKGKKSKYPIILDFDILDEKGVKILKKLARFLLERYMHPREFFGPTIKKEIIGKKKNKVEIIKHHDFYLRLKLASIRKKLKENVSINQFVAIDGDKYPGFVQVKRMIKALEIIAEGEQEIMIKEQEAKDKERKEKVEQEAKERAEKGLPPLQEEEPSKESENAKKKEKPQALELNSKSSTGPRGMLDEMLKLGGRGSPQNANAREGNRFGNGGLSGPSAQLNTIEEDLHETQTSHYSQALKEGDMTDREGSKHQLSTSNHLRNSNPLHELEDSARRSATATGANIPTAEGGQEVLVARTSPQKKTHKALDVRNSLPGCADASAYPLVDLEEAADQRLKDELDAEVDKKYKRQLASSQQDLDRHDDDYEEDFDAKDYQARPDEEEMKEDTIKTDKIEQLVEEDMKQKQLESQENKVGGKDVDDKEVGESHSQIHDQILNDLENQSIDELDVHADLEQSIKNSQKAETYIDRLDMNFDHEKDDPDGDYADASYENDEITNSQQNPVKQIASPQSEIDEDYEI